MRDPSRPTLGIEQLALPVVQHAVEALAEEKHLLEQRLAFAELLLSETEFEPLCRVVMERLARLAGAQVATAYAASGDVVQRSPTAGPARCGRAGAAPLHELHLPLTREGRMVAVIRLGRTYDVAFSAEEVASLSAIGQQASHALASAASRRSARQLAIRNAAMLVAIPDAVSIDLERARDAFVATISHELRTPLTAIIGYTETLLEGVPEELTERQRCPLEQVADSAAHLNRLVDDLLTSGRLDGGKLTLERAALSLTEVVTECVALSRPAASAKEIGLRLESGELPWLSGDRRRLAQLSVTLLTHAIACTPEHGQVTVRLSRANSHARLEVEHSGGATAGPEQQHLLEGLVVTSSTARAQFMGAGLGLSVAKAIVEAHRGEITVRNTEGVGTTFRVELPLEMEEAA